jgi:hypothetical protein
MMLILDHLCLLCSVIFRSTVKIHFHLYFLEFWLFLFMSLLICFKILYTLCWVPYVLCSKFVTNLSQEALCLLTYILAVAVFLLYSILSSSFFEFSHFYVIFLRLLIVLFGHPIRKNHRSVSDTFENSTIDMMIFEVLRAIIIMLL